ncbi:hypothetical protein [Kribbella deserti]|uniref:MFS transporter n=1 Tax=Kribbella deserti TaxID=1926257 RepID=A0ABV6QM19_9ACTN
MNSPGAGALRSVRAAAVAVVTVGIAAGSHVLGGGAPPHPLALLILSVLAAVPVHLLSGRRLGFGLLLVLLGGGQFVVHHLLMAMATMQPGGHPHEMPPMVHPAAPVPTEGPTMLIAHVVATLLTGLLLAHGESLLWALWSLLRPLLVVPGGFVAVSRPKPLPIATIRRPLRVTAFARPDRPRGPPLSERTPSITRSAQQAC